MNHIGGTVDEEGFILAAGLIEKIRRRRVETVGIPMVFVCGSEEIPATYDIVQVIILTGSVGVGFFLHEDVVGMRPAYSERTNSIIIAVVGPLKDESGSSGGSDLNVGEGLEEVAIAEIGISQIAMPGKRACH